MLAGPDICEMIGTVPQSDFAVAEAVERGLSTDSLLLLQEKGLTPAEISEIVISPRLLKSRRGRGEALSNVETDRVVRLARVLALANQVFANREKALRWLRLPSGRLSGRTPMSMLMTETGARLVESFLQQIDEGMFV